MRNICTLITFVVIVSVSVLSLPATQVLKAELNHQTREASIIDEENPLLLDLPGPIQHKITTYNDGSILKDWVNTDTWQYRTENIHSDGKIVSIYTNGTLYLMNFDKTGALLNAEKWQTKLKNPTSRALLQPTIFEKPAIETTRYKGIFVNVYETETDTTIEKLHPSTATKKVIVDEKYNLVLMSEHKSEVDSSIITTTYKYSYLQQDESLFVVPSDITFKEYPTETKTIGR